MNRFDTISKLFAERRLSRRQAVVAGGAGVVAVGLGSALAQDDTPEPAPGDATTEVSEDKTQYLFVQSYTKGTITSTDEPGRYTVTLEGGAGQTVYFADRPSRDVGAGPTDQFLEGLGFDDDNPPNAALVLEVEPGDQDIAVVELFNPTVDAETNTVTYDVTPLANWEQSLELGFEEAPTDLADLVPEFGAAHVFIDDCVDRSIYCWNPTTPGRDTERLGSRGFCYTFPYCHPCRDYSPECNQAFPDFCNGDCRFGCATHDFFLDCPHQPSPYGSQSSSSLSS